VLKLVLMAILLATLVIPIRNAQLAALDIGLRRTKLQMFGFITLWSLACLIAYAFYGYV
jgi:hypothetical protein